MQYIIGNFGFLNLDFLSTDSLCLHDLGLESRHREAYYFDNSTRDYQGFLFQYTIEGHGIYERQGTRHVMSKGNAFLITFPEESQYYLDANEPDTSWTYFYIHFSGPAAAPLFEKLRWLDKEAPGILSLELESPAIRLFFNLFHQLQLSPQLGKYQGSEWLYSFLVQLLRDCEFPTNKKSSPHVTASLNWLQLHYASALTLEDMSREIGISLPHLTRQFLKEQGMPPIQYLTQIRLEHALNLLLNTTLSVQEVATACGFTCGNYFAKVFKKVLQVSPSTYRKQRLTV